MENIELIEVTPNKYSDRRFKVNNYFTIGFLRPNFLLNAVYITLEPHEIENTPLMIWKNLKRMFDQWQGPLLWCEIELNEKTNARFAEFFGFRYERIEGGRALYLKETRNG